MDEEVKKIIDEALTVARRVVREKKKEIRALSDLLLEKETIDLKQIVGILGKRPFPSKSNYKAYLEEVISSF